MKPLIISLAISGRENYAEKVKGLEKSLIPFANEFDVRIYKEYPPCVTPHVLCPYRFKYELIEYAMLVDGYEKIFWLDSSMRLLKNPFDLLEQSEKGIVAFDNIGHETHKYITDKAVKNLRCENYLNKVNNTWGGCTGWDFSKSVPKQVLIEMLHQSSIGTFDNGSSKREDFVAARHDQSCLAVVLHKYKVPLLDYGIVAAKQHINQDTVIQYAD